MRPRSRLWPRSLIGPRPEHPERGGQPDPLARRQVGVHDLQSRPHPCRRRSHALHRSRPLAGPAHAVVTRKDEAEVRQRRVRGSAADRGEADRLVAFDLGGERLEVVRLRRAAAGVVERPRPGGFIRLRCASRDDQIAGRTPRRAPACPRSSVLEPHHPLDRGVVAVHGGDERQHQPRLRIGVPERPIGALARRAPTTRARRSTPAAAPPTASRHR